MCEVHQHMAWASAQDPMQARECLIGDRVEPNSTHVPWQKHPFVATLLDREQKAEVRPIKQIFEPAVKLLAERHVQQGGFAMV